MSFDKFARVMPMLTLTPSDRSLQQRLRLLPLALSLQAHRMRLKVSLVTFRRAVKDPPEGHPLLLLLIRLLGTQGGLLSGINLMNGYARLLRRPNHAPSPRVLVKTFMWRETIRLHRQ